MQAIVEVVRLLIKHGAKINVLDNRWRTSCYYCIHLSKLQMKLLNLQTKDPKDINATLPKKAPEEDTGLLDLF